MSKSRRTVPITIAVGCALGVACTEAEPDVPAVTRTDSAGIEIVASAGPAWVDGERWRVNPEPIVSIGQLDGEEPYLFGDVVGAVRVGESIVVGDAQALEVRYFDLDGVHQRSVAGAGDGPGELRTMFRLWRCAGDRVYANDRMRQLVQIFDPTGEFLSQVRPLEPATDRPRAPYSLVCSTEGDGYLGAGWGNLATPQAEPGTVFSQFAPVWLFDDEGRIVAELGEHLSSERFGTFTPGGELRGSGPHPLGSASSFALGPEQIFIGSGQALEVDVLTRDGALVRRLRGPADERLAITEVTVDVYLSAELPEEDERLREMLGRNGYPMPAALPAYTEMRLDPDGALWLRRFTPPWESENRWAIFAPDGVFLGHAELPGDVQLTDLGRDWVLGVAADELGGERVHLFALEKG